MLLNLEIYFSVTLDIEDRIACIEDDLETQRIDDDDHISGNAFAFMSKKIAGKMRNSFLPRMSSMRKSQGRVFKFSHSLP